MTSSKQPLLAAALSILLPGLGQLYNGHIFKGLLFFLTSFLVVPYIWGVIDAYLVARARLAPEPPALPAHVPVKKKTSLDGALVEAARRRGGDLSVTEGVADTGRSFEEIEAKLDQMAHKGYVDIGNRPDTGVVVYQFGQI